jgi:hypothetical protein
MEDKIRELLESEDLTDNKIGMQMLRTLTLGEVYEIVRSANFVHASAFPNGNIVDFVIATLFDVPVTMLRGLCRSGSSWHELEQWVESMKSLKSVPGRYLEIPFSSIDGRGAEKWKEEVLGIVWMSVDSPRWRIDREEESNQKQES